LPYDLSGEVGSDHALVGSGEHENHSDRLLTDEARELVADYLSHAIDGMSLGHRSPKGADIMESLLLDYDEQPVRQVLVWMF
jgi:hypothetical protein